MCQWDQLELFTLLQETEGSPGKGANYCSGISQLLGWNITLLWRAQTLRETSMRVTLEGASLPMVVLGGTERVGETFVQSYLCFPHYKEIS